MNKLLRCACGAAALLCAAAGPALCFQPTQTSTGRSVRWQAVSAGIYVNSANGPAGALTAVQEAMSTWTAVATSNFSFIYKGQTASTAYGENDGANILSFGPLADGNTLALNTFWYDDTTGYLQDSDIRFNTNHDWSTAGSPSALDVETIALHELGHALALDDLYGSANTDKVMYGFCSEGQIKRALTLDDRNGISYLYPGSGATTTIPYPGETCPAEYALGTSHPDLEPLRELRDTCLARSAAGRTLVRLYYDHEEAIRGALERHPLLRQAARGLCTAAARVLRERR